MSTQSFTIGSSPQRILNTTSYGIERTVVISTDQAIRVGTTASASQGMLIPGNNQPFSWPFKLQADDELFAVRAGSEDATVTVTSRPTWRTG